MSPERQRIFEFADGSYVMHPSLVLNPVILTALLLGVPFLIWRVRNSLTAQLLLGMLFFSTVVCYVPPIATFVGDYVVLPGQLWRLVWPIPLAALLTLGWLGWEATNHAAAWLGRHRQTRPLGRALPFLVVVALSIVAVPWAKGDIEGIQSHKEAARESGFWPADPVYYWFRSEIASPVVVLAYHLQSARITAYSSEANVISRRGNPVLRVLPELEQRAPGQIYVPRGALDVQVFFHGTDLETGVEILRRHEVDLLIIQSNSRLNRAIEELAGFEPVKEPSRRYDVYYVDLPTLSQQLDTVDKSRIPLPPQ